MSIIGHNDIDHLVNAAGFVWGTIHIIDQDQLGQFLGWELCPVNEILIDEVVGGTSIDHCFSSSLFHCILCPQLCWDHNAVGTFVK